MVTENDGTAVEADADAEKASNLRAIFEILSYIHADALKDNYKELADRIEFALNCAEEVIKGGSKDKASPQGDIGTAVVMPPHVVNGNQ